MSAVPPSSKNFVARPIKENPFSNISLDVIVPFKDNHAQVYNLINEIYSIRNVRLKIILVDDNSESAKFIEQFANLPWIKTHRFSENKGFGFCVNHGVKMAESNFCFVMHSDVYNLPKNIFKDMVLGLDAGKNDKLAMISAVLDNPVPKNCTYMCKNSAMDPEAYYSLLSSEQFMPLICVAFSKQAFSKVGGLPTYPLCFFEDKLLAEKFNLFNYKFGLCNRVFVRHRGSQTINNLLNTNPSYKTILEENKKRFVDDIKVVKSASQPEKDLTKKDLTKK
jgi:glycosyltransferase involved in cell wall biosynthesis